MLRRLFTVLFTVLSALSLLLCAATVVLWVRSYITGDVIQWVGVTGEPPRVMRLVGVESDRGGIGVNRERWSIPVLTPAEQVQWRAFRDRHPLPIGWTWRSIHSNRQGGSSFWGLSTDHIDEPVPAVWTQQTLHLTAHFTGAPYWFVTLLMAALPARSALWLLRRRQRRVTLGLCRRCGYDLRATPGRCPECGAVPAGQEA